MNQQAIDILDEMIKERPLHSDQDTLNEAKSRIQELDFQSNNGWIPEKIVAINNKLDTI